MCVCVCCRRPYLANFHVDAAVVLPDVEVEVLVVDAQVPALRQLALVPAGDGRHIVSLDPFSKTDSDGTTRTKKTTTSSSNQ